MRTQKSLRLNGYTHNLPTPAAAAAPTTLNLEAVLRQRPTPRSVPSDPATDTLRAILGPHSTVASTFAALLAVRFCRQRLADHRHLSGETAVYAEGYASAKFPRFFRVPSYLHSLRLSRSSGGGGDGDEDGDGGGVLI